MENVHEKVKQIGEEEEEEEYVLLELDDCLYSDIQPNAPYILSVSWFFSVSAPYWYTWTLVSLVNV
jgi:general transcription factor 3C polypeptide 6